MTKSANLHGSVSYIKQDQKASLTVEAALVLPLFVYFIISFLYFIQIFTVQELIQSAITKMGLSLSKNSYVLQEFTSVEDVIYFDTSIFGEDFEKGLEEFVDNASSEFVMKQYDRTYLDKEPINRYCIIGGFDGIRYLGSSLSEDDEYIDIIASYKVKIPVHIFLIDNLKFKQRVKLRCWTGYKVAAAYEEVGSTADSTMVYITETGSVYHKTAECSHIKLSVTAVHGIPVNLRNEYGAKYYPCETCCKGEPDPNATYYITSDGTRYHTIRNCSRIKRSVKEIPISKVGDRTPCKRCYP